ncbi:LpqB family beta-propeller domain-containing protein [Streptomyces sp. XM4193]|uniref:LpqB family beta-propeller domain-containing protein n=1 Tax=Streptomyces sp. XM4193 TaxID=2929782 RepID=UPI001FFBB0CA|nr:LpqB family beta-propeller domain-containing protein [Streptomyces sp. XM4193]MCK1799162.1 LpqB family beta-propeller domain-containing protein [Streptomyces sp. XM4193]
MKTERRVACSLFAVVALLLSGCASMPSGGDLKEVDSPQRAEAESQVRVFGVSPRKGEQPRHIVRGFLEATTSDEANFDTARKYLAPQAAESWRPFDRTMVVNGGPDVTPDGVRADADGLGFSVEVTGVQVAEVDGTNSYTPRDGAYLERFHLKKVNGEWRIDKLPHGLVVGEPDFERIYRSVNTYFYASLGQDAESVRSGRNVLVADPVYLRRRIDPLTETVSALLKGPSDWLRPVVNSAFPDGVRIAQGKRPSLDDSGALDVTLAPGGKGGRVEVDSRTCRRMAAQLLHTADQQSSATIQRVELKDGRGELCSTDRTEAADYAPGLLNGPAARQYYLDGSSRLIAIDEENKPGATVDGPFGAGHMATGSVAVSRDESLGAGVVADGGEMYVASLSGGGEFDDPALTSRGATNSTRLSAPSWDGLGDLWVADRDERRPRLLRLRDGRGEPETVPVAGLGTDRIEAIRMSADGTRIALLVDDGESTTLQLGRVERTTADDGEPVVRVRALRPAAPQLERVTAVSWAGASRLVLVGKEPGGVQQLRVVSTDGSAGVPPTLPGVNNVRGIAASENEERPLLADSEEGIVRLPRRDGNWQEVTKEGSAPIYPG